MFFQALRDITKRIKGLDPDELMEEVWKQEDTQEIIVELNTRGQLFNKGIDSEEDSLGEYAPFTIERKIESGLPTDRVTLFQEGNFYKSFYIIPHKKGFIIEADPIAGDSNLFDNFGEDIIGLTDDSKAILIQKIILRIQNEFRASTYL